MKSLVFYPFSFSVGLLFFAIAPTIAQEVLPLWTEGAMPYAISTVEEKPTLNCYPTQSQSNHTGAAVVICPGGGYGGLAKDHEGRRPAEWFNQQGVSAYVLHYRLGSQGYHYPAELADVQRAIRWVRAHAAEEKIDPERIAVMGFSAGGHLASMAATLFDEHAYDPIDAVDKVSARPDLAILCYPVISFDRAITHGGSRKNLLGPDRDGDDALAKKLSSDLNVTERTPPTFILQTDADTVVPAENALRFFLALREKKVSAELHVYEAGPHGVGLYLADPVLGTWSGHLKDWLRLHFFYAPPQPRSAVSGQATLDGKPVSWGALVFYPENSNLPPTTVRIRKGKFSDPIETGPITGVSRIHFEGSIWEETGSPDDQTVQLDSLHFNDKTPLRVDVKTGSKPLHFDFLSR